MGNRNRIRFHIRLNKAATQKVESSIKTVLFWIFVIPLFGHLIITTNILQLFFGVPIIVFCCTIAWLTRRGKKVEEDYFIEDKTSDSYYRTFDDNPKLWHEEFKKYKDK